MLLEGRADPGPGLYLSHGIAANELPLMRVELKPWQRSSGPSGMLELTAPDKCHVSTLGRERESFQMFQDLTGVSHGIFKETLTLHVLGS